MFLTTIYFTHGWSQTKNFRGNVEKFFDRMLDCWLMLDCPPYWGKYWLWFEKNCEKPLTGLPPLPARGSMVWSYNEAIRGNFAIIFLSDNDVLLLLLAVNICKDEISVMTTPINCLLSKKQIVWKEKCYHLIQIYFIWLFVESVHFFNDCSLLLMSVQHVLQLVNRICSYCNAIIICVWRY